VGVTNYMTVVTLVNVLSFFASSYLIAI